MKRWKEATSKKRRYSRMRRARKNACAPLLLKPLEPRLLLAADVVINEIMYHPSSSDPAHEYIELANFGDEAADLNGWAFTKGVNFTFPPVTIQPGEFLVVAADEAAFVARYGQVDHIVGGWTGKLANDSERIKLENAEGDQIDEVTYADEGDWADRRPQANIFSGYDGWTWEAGHDGEGKSLELINPALSNKRGVNWDESGPDGGTPGAPNSVAANDIAPIIRDVSHLPAVPTSTDQVTVTAEFEDEILNNVSASVFFRKADSNAGPFTEVQMFDDGLHGDGAANDGVWGAILPIQSDGVIVEYYVEATDGNLVRSWPAASNDAGTEHDANAHYQVDNEIVDPDVPFYRIIMAEQEMDRFKGIPNNSNAQMQSTFVSHIDGEYKVRHNVGVRIRGSGSRGRNPKNFRVNFPSDDTWEGVHGINLNAQYPYNQLLGMTIFQKAGLPSEGGRRVMLRMNSEDETRQTHNQFGSYVHLDIPSTEWAEKNYPADSDGNFYRGINGDLSYRGESPGSYRGSYAKKTNVEEDDWSDLIAMTRALSESETPDEVFVETLEAAADVQQWLRFFAVNALLVNEENGLINGRGDDYSMYAGANDPRIRFVVHDLDTILDQGDTAGSPTRNLFEVENHGRLDRVLQNPTYRSYYYAHLKQLAETVFSAEQLNPLIDEVLGDWLPTFVLNDMKDFAAARVNYVLGEIPPGTPELDPIQNDLRVTEIMYNPPAPTAAELAVDPMFDNDDFEFVELRNVGDTTINLEGVSIAQAIDYTFSSVDLDPGEYIVVAKNLAAFTARYGTLNNVTGPFTSSLSNGGEQIILSSAITGPFQNFEYNDGAGWPDRADGNGASLAVNNTENDYNDPANWNSSTEYGGSPGRAGLPKRSDVVVTEVLTHTDLPDVDAIELFNASRDPIDISHWYVSDDADNLFKYQIPAGTVLPSFGYLVLDENDFNVGGPNNPTPFALNSAEGDDVWLLEGDISGPKRFIDHIEFGAAANGVTFGRYTNSAGYLDITATSVSTLGSVNAPPALGDVVVNEIMYNPTPGHEEFVELVNRSESSVNLFDPANPANTWQFTNGIDFTFPQGVSLAPNELALVVPIDPAAYRTAHNIPVNIQIFGPYSGSLDNGGELLELSRPDTPELDDFVPMIAVERIRYNDKAPWSVEADGLGPSLSRTDLNAWSNEPDNWDAGIDGGTPGRANVLSDPSPPSTPEDLIGSMQGENLLLNWSPATDDETGIGFYRLYRNGQVVDTVQTTSWTDTQFSIIQGFSYEVSAVNGAGLEGQRSEPFAIPILQASFQTGVNPDGAYDGTSDAWIAEGVENDNFGSVQTIEVDGSDDDTGGSNQMSLIKWDISHIPVGSTILSASITLDYLNTSNGQEYELYRILRDWNENEVTWNQASNGNAWDAGGLTGAGDRDTEVLATISSSNFGAITHSLNSQGLDVIQSFVNDPSSNFGFLIADGQNTNGFSAHSSESNTVGAHPRLNLTYVEPLPVTETDVQIALTPRILPTNIEESATIPTSDINPVTGAGGEEFWQREGQSYWVEVWMKAEATNDSLEFATVRLDFDPATARVDAIDHSNILGGDDHSEINLIEGWIKFGGEANQGANAGNDSYALLGRVLFTGIAPIDPANTTFGPYSMNLSVNTLDTTVTTYNNGSVEADPISEPNVDIRAVLYDFDNNDVVNFADFGYFLAAKGKNTGGSEPPFITWADFNNDSVVDDNDQLLILSAFGKSIDDLSILFDANARSEGVSGGGGAINLMEVADGVVI